MPIAEGTAALIASGIAAAGSAANSGMANYKNMRMFRQGVAKQEEWRTQDYERSLENREYNTAANQMHRLRQAGLSNSGSAASLMGGSGNMGSINSPGSTSPPSAPNMTAPEFQKLGSVYQQMADYQNLNADSLLKMQEANKTRIESLGAQYDNALKERNSAFAAQTFNARSEAIRLDNMLTLQQVYKTELESGLTRAQTFKVWLDQTNRTRELNIEAYKAETGRIQADINRSAVGISSYDAETRRLDYTSKSPYYYRNGLLPEYNTASDIVEKWNDRPVRSFTAEDLREAVRGAGRGEAPTPRYLDGRRFLKRNKLFNR